MSKLPPVSFQAESLRQRETCVERLEKEIEEIKGRSANEHPLEFSREDEGSFPFLRAARAVLLLRDPADSSPSFPHPPIEGYHSIVMRPYPWKSKGAWRIEVGYARGYGGMAGGAEWYVDEEELWEAWEKAK